MKLKLWHVTPVPFVLQMCAISVLSILNTSSNQIIEFCGFHVFSISFSDVNLKYSLPGKWTKKLTHPAALHRFLPNTYYYFYLCQFVLILFKLLILL